MSINLNEFLTNCNNSIALASDFQKTAVFAFIISRLTGSARSLLQGKTYQNWDELKQILCQHYQDKKHYIQLMEELNTLKQNTNESVASFHERIEKIITRILGAMTCRNDIERNSKIQIIKELGLSRFIHHSVPEISRFLRSQNLETMSAAFSKAIEEERAIKISREEFKTKSNNISNKFCQFCKRNGHQTRDCYKKQNTKINSTINLNQPTPSNIINQNNNLENSYFRGKTCKYCKKYGHLINECRKLAYVNNKRQTLPNSSSNEQVHLNSSAPQVNAALVETDIHEA